MIKIDMEMPKSCERCRFNIRQRCYAGDFVIIMPEAFINRRHSKCPLQEVKEVKKNKWSEGYDAGMKRAYEQMLEAKENSVKE